MNPTLLVAIRILRCNVSVYGPVIFVFFFGPLGFEATGHVCVCHLWGTPPKDRRNQPKMQS